MTKKKSLTEVWRRPYRKKPVTIPNLPKGRRGTRKMTDNLEYQVFRTAKLHVS